MSHPIRNPLERFSFSSLTQTNTRSRAAFFLSVIAKSGAPMTHHEVIASSFMGDYEILTFSFTQRLLLCSEENI